MIPLPLPEPALEASPFRALWEQIASFIRPQVSADTFQRWFSAMDVLTADERTVTLRAPNSIHKIWIESNYLGVLGSAIGSVLGAARKIQFAIQDEPMIASASAARGPMLAAPLLPAAVRAPESEPAAPVNNGLNPRFTFETFVVGPNTEFANAAALAVAKKPVLTYNPLFMYGGVGLGKTHLMQAIGQAILAAKPTAKVMYLTSEQFTNDFINSLEQGSIVKFRKRYRAIDVLLIDDVQFFAGKEKTQDEFFHTFNELTHTQKQIVLSCDRPPSEIGGLEQRLVSRFEQGLTTEIIAPDMETRFAILRRKAHGLSVTVPDAVLEFLAVRIRANIRRLEGALMRVATFASLNPGELKTETIETLLRDILQEEARRVVTIEQIQKAVAEQFDLRLSDMTSKRRPANIAFPRQVAMYLARELTKFSLNEIGEAFGGRDHGTVLHAHRLVKTRLGEDDRLRQIVGKLERQLN